MNNFISTFPGIGAVITWTNIGWGGHCSEHIEVISNLTGEQFIGKYPDGSIRSCTFQTRVLGWTVILPPKPKRCNMPKTGL